MGETQLGRMQFRIMQVLWDLGRANAREITDALCASEPVAHSTVQTLLRQLEAKGAVGHEATGRTFVFCRHGNRICGAGGGPVGQRPDLAGAVIGLADAGHPGRPIIEAFRPGCPVASASLSVAGFDGFSLWMTGPTTRPVHH